MIESLFLFFPGRAESFSITFKNNLSLGAVQRVCRFRVTFTHAWFPNICLEKMKFLFYYYKALSLPIIINLSLYNSDSAMSHTVTLK